MDDLKQLLIERLDKNLADYRDHLMGFDQWALIDMAARIAHTQEVHDYLVDRYGFREGEIEYLLRFQNPLEVVTDAWEVQRQDIADLDFIMHSVCDRKDSLADYPLYTEAEKPATGQKSSILGQLRDAAKDAQAQPPKDGPGKDNGAR